MFLIVGGRKISQLKGNIDALRLELDPEDIDEIEEVSHFNLRLPMNIAFELAHAKYRPDNTTKNVSILK